jgi:hypothetical protein
VIVDHELPSLDLVDPKEVDEVLAAGRCALEKPVREVLVQVFDAPADLIGVLELGKASLEGTQVDLEDVVGRIGVIVDDPLLGSEVFRYTDLPTLHDLGVDLDVAPPGYPFPHRHVDEGAQEHRFLNVPHDGPEPGLIELLSRLHDLILVLELGLSDDPFTSRAQVVEEEMELLTM